MNLDSKTILSFLPLLIIFIIVWILSSYTKKYSQRKQKNEKELALLDIEHETDKDLSAQVDFGKYAKKIARHESVPKEKLLEYLIKNKIMLLSMYLKKTNRKINNNQDLSLIFIKIYNEY